MKYWLSYQNLILSKFIYLFFCLTFLSKVLNLTSNYFSAFTLWTLTKAFLSSFLEFLFTLEWLLKTVRPTVVIWHTCSYRSILVFPESCNSHVMGRADWFWLICYLVSKLWVYHHLDYKLLFRKKCSQFVCD